MIGEHVELGSHPRHERARQRGAECVGVGVDQARQQRAPGAIHHRQPGRNREIPSDATDLRVAHDNGGALQHLSAVEHADISDHEFSCQRRGSWRCGPGLGGQLTIRPCDAGRNTAGPDENQYQ